MVSQAARDRGDAGPMNPPASGRSIAASEVPAKPGAGPRLRQRSCARTRRSLRSGPRICRPQRVVRWQFPKGQALAPPARCRRHALLSWASGFEVAECELLQASPLLAPTAPWLGPAQAEQPLRFFACANLVRDSAWVPSGLDSEPTLSVSASARSTWPQCLHYVASRFRAVFFSPRFDPLPACPQAQAVLAELIRQCTGFGLQCWVQTRGVILPVLRDALVECRANVRLTLAFATFDDGLARALEPGAAPPRLRLRQLHWLHRMGITTQVTLAPLIPDLTDTPTSLLPLLTTLREMGITRATLGYLVLDPLASWEHPSLQPRNWAEPIAELYEAGQLRRWGATLWARCLAWRERQRRYARLIAWASELGLELRPNTLADPDFRANVCRAHSPQPGLAWPN